MAIKSLSARLLTFLKPKKAKQYSLRLRFAIGSPPIASLRLRLFLQLHAQAIR